MKSHNYVLFQHMTLKKTKKLLQSVILTYSCDFLYELPNTYLRIRLNYNIQNENSALLFIIKK